MQWFMKLVCMTAGGWAGWWLGGYVGTTTALIVSVFGGAAGLYAGIRINQELA